MKPFDIFVLAELCIEAEFIQLKKDFLKYRPSNTMCMSINIPGNVKIDDSPYVRDIKTTSRNISSN